MPADGEPRWTTEDRAVVAVWQDEEATRCRECGTYDWEQEENQLPWEPVIHLCRHCEQVEWQKAQINSDHKPEAIHGWKIRLMDRRFSNGE